MKQSRGSGRLANTPQYYQTRNADTDQSQRTLNCRNGHIHDMNGSVTMLAADIISVIINIFNTIVLLFVRVETKLP